MNDKIKRAFDSIYAEESLKRNTLVSLRSKMERMEQKDYRTAFRRAVVALACFLVLTLLGGYSYNAYFTETMYVDIDINPSVELTVNRFDRIIGVYAYNAEGGELLTQLDLMHTPYDSAVTMLTEAAIQNSFLSDGGLVSVTLQSNRDNNTAEALKTLHMNITSVAQGQHSSVLIDVFPVDSGTREHAHAQNLSPAKYLAILALQEVDPAATIAGCRNHTITEIHALTEEHGGGHHSVEDSDTALSDSEDCQNGGSAISQESANSHGNGHHGSGHE